VGRAGGGAGLTWPLSILQVARSRSERTLDMEVRTSATKKSANVMGCSGSSMRPSVVRKKKREGACSTSTGRASSSGRAAYSAMGWTVARPGAPWVKQYRNRARLDTTARPSQHAIWGRAASTRVRAGRRDRAAGNQGGLA
jgi:hypothetical protein